MIATAYTYDVLNEITSIRLLKIKPMAAVKDSSSDPGHGYVSCTLRTFNDNIPPYSALSYCWGDTEENRQHIYLGDTLVEVHKSLWEFLNQMQSSGKTETWFWTDFLCLNQSNDNEKAKQIPRMGTIYTQAKETISWLGCEASSATQHVPNLGNCLKLIETRVSEERREVVEKFFKNLPNWTTIMKHKTSGLWPRVREESVTTEPEELDELEKQICRLGYGLLGIPLNDILLLPYWTRVWIVQEVAMGSHVKLTYGPDSINFDDFFLAYKCHLYHLMKSSQGNADVPVGTAVAIQARAARRDKDISMHRILQWGMRCDSTLSHDRIYGLLGLLSSYDSRESSTFGSLTVDYERDITSVFWDVVFACRALIKEEAETSHLIQEFLEITAFFPRLADALRCSFSLQSLFSYLDAEEDLGLNKELTKRMISIFQSVGSEIFLSTSSGIYSQSTDFPSDILRPLRMRRNPDPDPDSKFQSLESDLATIFLECVDSGVDRSAEIHAALVALRLAQRSDLGSGGWSCVPAQDKPGDDEESGGKNKILERQVRWTRSAPDPSPEATSRCSLANHRDHRCHGSSLHLNLPDSGWSLRLDIQRGENDGDDEDWIHGKLSIILNSTFTQPKYGHLIFRD